MLIEQCAYGNRWRLVSPAAKAIVALGGFAAAFAAAPPVALGIACLLAGAVILGAGVAPGVYGRVAAPALTFLALGCLPLVFSFNTGGGFALQPTVSGLAQAQAVAGRAAGGLAALLFLVLTTPLPDLIALLRRINMPEILLDIMVLCYRMVFVLSTAVSDTLTAQTARQGYASPRLALRSLGGLGANLAVQVWRRAHILHVAAQARNNDGPLIFLTPVFPAARGQIARAALAAVFLVALAVGMG